MCLCIYVCLKSADRHILRHLDDDFINYDSYKILEPVFLFWLQSVSLKVNVRWNHHASNKQLFVLVQIEKNEVTMWLLKRHLSLHCKKTFHFAGRYITEIPALSIPLLRQLIHHKHKQQMCNEKFLCTQFQQLVHIPFNVVFSNADLFILSSSRKKKQIWSGMQLNLTF